MYLDENGVKWYKGNLHTHTTRSDGARTPDEVVAMYRGAGYDFLALTDHWIRSETVEEKNFLRLSGCEFDLGHNVQEGIFHIVAVGTERMPGLKRGSFTLQGAVDEIRSCGGAAILAHPAWSLNRAEQILPVNGFAAAEIYNSVSGTPWNARPYSGVLIDDLAVLGRLMPCSAADDAHFYNGDQTRSYLMNEKKDIFVVTPEFVPGGQLIFRDNIQPMIWNRSVLLMLSSVTTGKTVNRVLECIRYYGGNVVDVSAIFSAISQVGEMPIHSIFNTDDLPGYQTYSPKECPECAKQHKIDAIVNSYGYSRV